MTVVSHTHDVDAFLANEKARMIPLRGALTWEMLTRIVDQYRDQEQLNEWNIEEWDPATIIHVFDNPYNGCATLIIEPPVEV